jgi:hypothetical protein
MQSGVLLAEWLGARGMENLAFFLSRLSSLVIEAWASCARSLRRGTSYGGGTVLAMAVH